MSLRTTSVLMGNGQSDRVARTGAAPDRRPQAGRIAEPSVQTLGTVVRAGFRIEKLTIAPEEGIVLPTLLFLPEKPKANRVVLTFTSRARRPMQGPAAPSSSESKPAMPSWRSIFAEPDRRGRLRPATIRPNTRMRASRIC